MDLNLLDPAIYPVKFYTKTVGPGFKRLYCKEIGTGTLARDNLQINFFNLD